MGSRIGIVLIFVLGILLRISDARLISVSEVVVMETGSDAMIFEVEEPEVAVHNEKLCSLCEDFATKAIDYLSQNKSRDQIIDSLHKACSQLHSLEQRCLLLVDYYTPLFFSEVDQTDPEKFCKKVNLCEETYLLQQRSGDTCSACHQAVVEILLKLKDPDNQLEIIEALLKACNKMDNYAQQCKKMVFQYGPVILVNAEKFLETTDVCTYIGACKSMKEQDLAAADEVGHSQIEISDS